MIDLYFSSVFFHSNHHFNASPTNLGEVGRRAYF
jgi:hypothetical protein